MQRGDFLIKIKAPALFTKDKTMAHKEPREIRFIFADFHMGEGEKDGKINPLELFNADSEFCHTVDNIMETHGSCGAQLELNLNGDTFDFLRVPFHGRIKAEPTEEAAIEKIKIIFSAHPLVVETWRKFLSRGGKIKFFIGNHDLELVWPNVQNFIRQELSKNQSHNIDSRIEFLFEEIKNGVHISHGNNAEWNSTVRPEKVFLTKRLGQPLNPPLLRHPYGNHLVTDQANVLSRGTKLFKGNWWVGRVEPHRFVILEALAKNKWFALWAIIIWFITPFCHRFSRRWWVRKSASLWTLFRLNWNSLVVAAYNKLRGKDFTDYAKKILAENKNIDVVISAHIHTCILIKTKDNTIMFTGNGSTAYDWEMPKLDLKWKRFRRLEKALRYLAIIRRMFNPKTRHLYAPQKREFISFGICKFFGDGRKEVALMRYDPKEDCLKNI